MKGRIEKHDDSWRIVTADDDVFEVSSINAHCETKLEALHDADSDVYIRMEAITDYHSEEYRVCISASDDDWYDEYEDVACLLRDYDDEDEVAKMIWYSCELWIVDEDGNQHQCWTANFTSAEACRTEVLQHYRHSTSGRPRIHRINDDGTKTFIEDIDMRTPEQIEHFHTQLEMKGAHRQ